MLKHEMSAISLPILLPKDQRHATDQQIRLSEALPQQTLPKTWMRTSKGHRLFTDHSQLEDNVEVGSESFQILLRF